MYEKEKGRSGRTERERGREESRGKKFGHRTEGCVRREREEREEEGGEGMEEWTMGT